MSIRPTFEQVLQIFRPPAKAAHGASRSDVSEGDDLAGFHVIATPGHTRGHTSLLSDRHGLLFTADAYGTLPLTPSGKAKVGVCKFLCTDPTQAQRSAEKLLEEEFETVVFSHGKPLREGAKRRLREIAGRAHHQ